MDIKQKALYIYFIIINKYIHAILACHSVSMFSIVDKRDVDSNQRCSISCQHLTANYRHQAADTEGERVTLLELHPASKQYHVLYLTAIHVGDSVLHCDSVHCDSVHHCDYSTTALTACYLDNNLIITFFSYYISPYSPSLSWVTSNISVSVFLLVLTCILIHHPLL